MDETIGIKGGHNDLRRTKIITKEKRKKLEDLEEQEIRELEEELKKKQVYVLIKTLPIIIGGTTLRAFQTRKEREKENPFPKKKEKKETEQKPSIIHEINIIYQQKEQNKTKISNNKKQQEEIKRIPKEGIQEEPKEIIQEEKKEEVLEEKKTKEQEEKIEKVKKEIIEEPSKENKIVEDFEDLPVSSKQKLEQLKSRKIIEEYEKRLKDIRFDLRKTVYDFIVLNEEKEDIQRSNEALIILDKLSILIDRIEELKKEIKIENLSKYDDNYIYYLIESYFDEFKSGRVIEELKDSPLYITIAEKLEEISKKKDYLYKEVENKKEVLEEKEKNFEEIKNSFYPISQFNNDLLTFQKEQERLLQEIREKVDNSKTVKERVETEVKGMNRQTRRLLRLLTFQMLLPSPKYTKGVASSTAAYLYFMKNVINPNTVTKKYEVVMVKDYSDEILHSINELDSILIVLDKTSDQIDKIILEVKDKYKEYSGVLKEYDELLRSLNKVKNEMKEKEYEIKKIKEQQELELERNNAKVKTRGEYPVN